ncbi:MAG: hypothetical protein JOS17DRAFT_812933 [Linnemannia elongata]|nr:MAG: hypothetical protein JOS17DRAFT_812933 [Linnemannia elongata]
MKFSTLITLTVASTLAILSKSDALCAGKCPSVITPVCAQNAAGVQQTFVNSCELAKSNCKDPSDVYTKISNKQCPGDDMFVKRGIFDGPTPVPGCVETCPAVISRVCAQNNVGVQVTFVNSCRLSVTQCKYPSEQWTQISKGYCAGDMSKRGILDGRAPVAGCPKTCPAVINRVCGQSATGVQHTFINICGLTITQCQYPTEGWTKVSDGYCPNDENLSKKRSIWDQPIPEPNCNQECPSVISPVCAQNQVGTQKTFVNSCRMTVANCQYPADQWTIVERKTCLGDMSKRSIVTDGPIAKKCPQKCPDVISPVCGQDNTGKQVTFTNSCLLSVAKCQYPAQGWTQITEKTCIGDLD